MKRAFFPMALALLAVLPVQFAGCAARTTTTEVVGPADTTVVERHHTETVVDADDDNGGILSGIFEILGDIIALPFRAIAGLFDLLF